MFNSGLISKLAEQNTYARRIPNDILNRSIVHEDTSGLNENISSRLSQQMESTLEDYYRNPNAPLRYLTEASKPQRIKRVGDYITPAASIYGADDIVDKVTYVQPVSNTSIVPVSSPANSPSASSGVQLSASVPVTEGFQNRDAREITVRNLIRRGNNDDISIMGSEPMSLFGVVIILLVFFFATIVMKMYAAQQRMEFMLRSMTQRNGSARM